MVSASEPSTTAYDRLASAIREEILSGALRPGDRLPTEPELSAYYRVSRNTAREAIRALASQGLVKVKRGVAGGTFVSAPSFSHISQTLRTGLALVTDGVHLTVSALMDVREMLEVPAAEFAARLRTDEELAAIRRTLFDPAEVDPGNVFDSNRDFHTCLLRATHNPLLEVLAEPVFRVLKERFLRERAPASFWAEVDREHREIIGFLECGDQAGAREANRAHLRHLRGTYERLDRLTAKTSEVYAVGDHGVD
ncbi:FadR family transcriptional regulator [Amycolatopsis acidiphila]|uniref:FadR family transcriptional regulator n=1 Tax=Amycolatopsis acidiphila TaxID=715473 RepID=A0A558AGU4_9PSEU|nr:FadR/GntR family transcriptional regulator [Amycolatopsis acidiphila]TVT23431.1 FadR family transcriptional regulator [Amycolatopsis acidiphila]UIJ59881.1 FadR family transcriptional regulator [Amycolatopsis acidiphila]GHG62668.1 GntR family transcriptional regulator [Amycolatopsis acidiphila]